MFDEMNASEIIIEQVEEKVLYKILYMIKESKNLEELEKK